MNYAIWGIGKLGQYTENSLTNKGISVSYYVDNNEKLHGKKINGISVISFENFKNECLKKDYCLLMTVKNSKNFFNIVKQLENSSVKQIGIVKARAEEFNLNIDLNENEIIWIFKSDIRKKVIPRIEMNLIDGCNLKCKGCTHFSNIYKEDSIYPIDKFHSDMLRLREACDSLLRLRLLGGEPLLINNLDEYIDIARDIFPESDIEVVTNGLLVPKLSDKIINSFTKNNISVIISPYQPTVKNAEKINSVLNKHNVHYCFSAGDVPIKEFSRNITLNNNNDMYISSDVCNQYGCTFFRNGNLYKCPFDGLIKDFGKYYNIEFKVNNGFNIYDNSNEEIYKYIEKLALEPVEMCRYCSENIEMIPWEVKNNPELSDWIYQNEK